MWHVPNIDAFNSIWLTTAANDDDRLPEIGNAGGLVGILAIEWIGSGAF
ncbi:hypothetical protein X768_22890 [Mesorhizobium sp. LSJC265A00]|nr:hypothetical protein X768_22890 [Mesorhizobium sp. LSJC265A00]